jgi:hypothetical protein
MLRSILIAVCLVALLAGQAAPGRCAEDEKDAPLDPIQKEMKRIRGMIINANMKLNSGAMGIKPRGQGSSTPTPAQQCCSVNLEHIAKSMKSLNNLMIQRRTCFEQQQNIDGVFAGNLVVQDLRDLATALNVFSQTPDRNQTVGAMGATQRAYLNLLKSVDALPDCEPLEPPQSEQ